MRENLTSGSMWQGMETRVTRPQAPFPDPTTRQVGFAPPKGVDSGFGIYHYNEHHIHPPTYGCPGKEHRGLHKPLG